MTGLDAQNRSSNENSCPNVDISRESERGVGMSQNEWMARRWKGYVPPATFEEYSEKYAEFFAMKRENGIIEVRFQTDGDTYTHSWAAHNAWGRVWQDIGNDLDNEVL